MNTMQLTPGRQDRQPPDSAAPPGPPLYVATDLDASFPDDPEEDEQDVWIGQKLHRRLDPPYYAWLRGRMILARQANEEGRLPPAAFNALRERFNHVHGWAVQRFGTLALREACDALDPRAYQPPGWKPKPREASRRRIVAPTSPSAPAYLYPSGGEWRFHQAVSPVAIAKVDAIRKRALSLGWSMSRLYQNRGRFRFPLGEDYGLVCFVGDDECLGEVTIRHIEIHGIPPRDHLLKFSNPDAEQHWNRKARQ